MHDSTLFSFPLVFIAQTRTSFLYLAHMRRRPIVKPRHMLWFSLNVGRGSVTVLVKLMFLPFFKRCQAFDCNLASLGFCGLRTMRSHAALSCCALIAAFSTNHPSWVIEEGPILSPLYHPFHVSPLMHHLS